MAEWIGPTVAISLALIALCFLGIAAAVALTLKEAVERGQSLAKELGELRRDLGPTLQALNRLGTGGAEVVELAQEEVREIIYTTRRLRKDVEKSVTRARRRLADFEAVVEVVQEEVEETALDLGAALRTVRTGSGVIGRLRRLVLPRRRGGA
ncbi:MAG: hypothetical protein ABIZ70_13195 [Gemmatimonadales bacterium]